MSEQVKEDFNRPKLEPIHDEYRLAEDWTTNCFHLLTEDMTVPKGFVTDGASIPRLLWTICGSPMQSPRIYAALIHDWLYELGGTDDDRKFADKLYRDYNIKLGMGKIRAYIEYDALRLFGGTHWKYTEKK